MEGNMEKPKPYSFSVASSPKTNFAPSVEKLVKVTKKMDWKKQKVLVTGGASFIGSHMVDSLVDRGAFVRVADAVSYTHLTLPTKA